MKKIEAYPVGIYMLKVNNRNIRREICSTLAIKIPERLPKALRLTVYPEDFLQLHQISFIEAEY